MLIIFGLGNFGKEYENTFHNLGFNFVDRIANELCINFSLKKNLKAEIAETKVNLKELKEKFNLKIKNENLEKIILVKPQTYMNLSGECVVKVMKHYRATLNEIIVALDDIDLPIGKFRFREQGSAGTHNGLRNIVLNLHSTEFKRVRIGIASEHKCDLADYVLSKIPADKKELLENATIVAIKEMFDKCLI